MADLLNVSGTSSNFCQLGTQTAVHCDEVIVGAYYKESGIFGARIGVQLQIILFSVILLLFVK